MKKENRELLIRAIGMIDGLCFAAPAPIDDGLADVLEKLDAVLEGEGNDES